MQIEKEKERRREHTREREMGIKSTIARNQPSLAPFPSPRPRPPSKQKKNFLLTLQGYSGVEVRVTPMRTEVIIRATRTQDVLGVKGRRIRELTAAVQKRFRFADGSVELYAEKVNSRGLCAVAQAESLRYKLLGGLAVRRACYGVLRYVMEAGAKGCEVVVSGKLRAQRAKAMKFSDG